MGIDPGKNGAIAAITPSGPAVWPWGDDTLIDVCNMLTAEATDVRACVELVSSMPKQGVKSTFTFGKAAGYIAGVLSAFEIGYQLVPPNKWKRDFGLLRKTKADSITVCKRLFPKVNLRRTGKCRVEHDGMAEALLMAEYARRHL